MAGLLGDVEHHQPAMTASLLKRFCRTSRTLPISIWFPYQAIGGSLAGECSGSLLPRLASAHIYYRRWMARGRGVRARLTRLGHPPLSYFDRHAEHTKERRKRRQ